MTTQFLSKTDRIDKNTIPLDRNSTSGPGSYFLPTSMKTQSPGFAPFTTSGHRSKLTFDESIPPPGTYNLATDLISKTPTAATAFKSKTDRFEVKDRNNIPKAEHPLEKELNVKQEDKNDNQRSHSSFDKFNNNENNKGRPKQSHVSQGVELLRNIMQTAPPSVPTRFQSFGYEEDEETGKLNLNKPFGIITGLKEDKVGPGQYNIDRQIANGKAMNFGKGPLRQLDAANLDSIAPGTYNLFSNFDLAEIGKNRTLANKMNKENEVYLKMYKNSTKLKSSTFASQSKREAFPDTSITPGPGLYTLPTAIKLTKVYQEVPIGGDAPRFQSEERAARDAGPSPFTYNPLTSDFDKDKIHILKSKKMRSSSGWAQNISFATTAQRPFNGERAYSSDGPDPGAYDPKLNIADFIPKQNPHSGPFGMQSERFKKNNTAYPPDRDAVISQELTKEYNEQNPPNRVESPSSRFRNRRRAVTTSNFVEPPDRSSLKDKMPDGPPPNNYNTTPSWDFGTAKMKAATMETIPKFQKELINRKNDAKNKAPGPQAYCLPTSIVSANPLKKNVSMGTSSRDGPVSRHQQELPPPGAYNLATTLEKKSHNIYLESL